MPSLLSKIKDGALDILFPPLCVLCRKTLLLREKSAMLCAACRAAIPSFDTLFCAECHARLPETKKTCHNGTLYRLGAASTYASKEMRELIWTLKYGEHPVAAHAMSRLLIDYMEKVPVAWNEYTVIPVPLHPSRLRARGFNQSVLLGKPISVRFNLPFSDRVLIRTKKTTPQAECRDHGERKTNIAGCFQTAPSAAGILKNNKILLIDDVTTSGATLTEAAAVLKSAGAREIIALVAARAG